jgi:hypothetical protein
MSAKTVNPIFGLIGFGFVFLGIISLALRGLYLDEEFDTNARRSEATIDQVWTTTGSKGSTHYHARYHFIDDVGMSWVDNSTVALTSYRSLQSGSMVPVKYLESDPGQSRIDWPSEREWHWRQDESLACIGLVVGGFGLLIFLARRPKTGRTGDKRY